MSDFNPLTLYHILLEVMGAWLWLLMLLALVLFSGVVSGILKLRRASRPVRRPLIMALAVGVISALVLTFLVPSWTLAGADALTGALDYLFAFLLALAPAAMIGSAVFFLAATRCASRAKAT